MIPKVLLEKLQVIDWSNGALVSQRYFEDIFKMTKKVLFTKIEFGQQAIRQLNHVNIQMTLHSRYRVSKGDIEFLQFSPQETSNKCPLVLFSTWSKDTPLQFQMLFSSPVQLTLFSQTLALPFLMARSTPFLRNTEKKWCSLVISLYQDSICLLKQLSDFKNRNLVVEGSDHYIAHL